LRVVLHDFGIVVGSVDRIGRHWSVVVRRLLSRADRFDRRRFEHEVFGNPTTRFGAERSERVGGSEERVGEVGRRTDDRRWTWSRERFQGVEVGTQTSDRYRYRSFLSLSLVGWKEVTDGVERE
jgi:hypothetical protein